MAVDNALKRQLLSAAYDMYYKSLRNRSMGYVVVTKRKLLSHLFTIYGRITLKDSLDNDKM